MTNTDTDIRNRIESFVAEMTALIRQAAVESAIAALNGSNGYSGAKRGPKPKNANLPTQGGKRVRRSEKDILQMMSKVVAFIESNPGSRSEDIRAKLGVTAPQLADSLRRLIADKSIKSKGQRRGTTYSKA